MVEYFADHYQIQVNELSESLNKLINENKLQYESLDQIEIHNQTRRKVLKKLLSFMTMGLDLSKLFSQVVMISSTSDPVQKKIIYQYLTHYADSNTNLSILAVNALQKDSKDPDPLIRSLAIRSLCTLKAIDYSLPIIKAALSDSSFVVQNSAIISSIRLLKQDSGHQVAHELSKSLYRLLHSSNPSVVANSIFAIAYIKHLKGLPVELSKNSVFYLIDRFKTFSEWNQIFLLSVLNSYKPANEEEMYSLLNQMDYFLSLNSVSLVLGASKCFLAWTRGHPNLSFHVIKRISKPLITLASTSAPELSYIVYDHLLQIISNVSIEDKTIFNDLFIQFYLKASDTNLIQSLKLKILSEIINEVNYEFILEHLQFYINNDKLSEELFGLLVKIGINYSETVDKLINTFKICLEFENKKIVEYSIESIRQLVIYYPEHSLDTIAYIENIRDSLVTYKSKAVFVSLVGEFGGSLDSSPYVIDEYMQLCKPENKFVADFVIFVEELLIATVKIFVFKSPEAVDSLVKLIEFIVVDNICPYLLERCALYYRLLHSLELNKLNNILFGGKVKFFWQSNYKVDNWIDKFNKLHFDDIATSDESFINVQHVDSVHDIFNPSKHVKLIKARSVTPGEFESKWFELDGPHGRSTKISKPFVELSLIPTFSIDISLIDTALTDLNIEIIAFGKIEEEVKYFLFCSDELSNDYYLQLIINKEVDLLCKTSVATESECVENLLNLIVGKILSSTKNSPGQNDGLEGAGAKPGE